MRKFNCGDYIIGNSQNKYGITKTGWIGKVTAVRTDSVADIAAVCANGNDTEYFLCSSYFDLYDITNKKVIKEDSSYPIF